MSKVKKQYTTPRIYSSESESEVESSTFTQTVEKGRNTKGLKGERGGGEGEKILEHLLGKDVRKRVING